IMTSQHSTSNYVNCTNAIEPPYTERYVRWCERSATQSMGSLLLDCVNVQIIYGSLGRSLLPSDLGLQIDFPVAHHFGNVRIQVRAEETRTRIQRSNLIHIL
ncbi:hypothetical protein SAMN05216192_1401, partial [Paenibacillus typhae]